jgi:hypothetical protein
MMRVEFAMGPISNETEREQAEEAEDCQNNQQFIQCKPSIH